MQATAVIGAVFGDEGKGRCTDQFSKLLNTVVVRYNGGAQAGHTVQSGKRHVFSHFGSGTFNGAPTYLSGYFLVNPLLWNKERADLGFCPTLYINPAARVTTPYDMLINRAMESRANPHGSCGYGINETVERSLTEHCLTVSDLASDLPDRLKAIREQWVPKRMQQVGLSTWPDEFKQLVDNQQILAAYLSAATELLSNTTSLQDGDIGYWDNVVFEGAQGLLLDEDNTVFHPHLTRSKCGLRNVEKICQSAGINDLRVVYVTRAYATRHGAGPFPTWDPSASYVDETNQPNQFQGTMRFGKLNLDLLAWAIKADTYNSINVTRELAITCLDQVGDSVDVLDGEVRSIRKCDLPEVAARIVEAESVHLSNKADGPLTRVQMQLGAVR